MNTKEVLVVVNPVIGRCYEASSEIEGCASLPGLLGSVRRFNSIRCTYNDLGGNRHESTLNGFSARI
jgi:peptide deformylase